VVRGLLCHNCNMLLGFAHDSIDVLQSAVQYLLDTQEGADIPSNWHLRKCKRIKWAYWHRVGAR
jgi:hypothetical protein